jgi:hypothetical protein
MGSTSSRPVTRHHRTVLGLARPSAALYAPELFVQDTRTDSRTDGSEGIGAGAFDGRESTVPAGSVRAGDGLSRPSASTPRVFVFAATPNRILCILRLDPSHCSVALVRAPVPWVYSQRVFSSSHHLSTLPPTLSTNHASTYPPTYLCPPTA